MLVTEGVLACVLDIALTSGIVGAARVIARSVLHPQRPLKLPERTVIVRLNLLVLARVGDLLQRWVKCQLDVVNV